MAVMEAAESAQLYETGGFRVDATQRVLFAADGTRVALSSRAFDLLLYFVRHPGQLLDKNQLMTAVWPNTIVEENNLNQSIGALRKALGESAGEHRFLVNEPGRGYRFVAPVRVLGEIAPQPLSRESRRRWPLAGGAGAIGDSGGARVVVARARACSQTNHRPLHRGVALRESQHSA